MTRKGDCKHYTGTQNAACEAGVNYRTLAGGPRDGWGLRLPCQPSVVFRHATAVRVSCALFAAITAEEEAAEAAEWKRVIAAIDAGRSPCCDAALDESRVVTRGANRGSGVRYCSACGVPVFRGCSGASLEGP